MRNSGVPLLKAHRYPACLFPPVSYINDDLGLWICVQVQVILAWCLQWHVDASIGRDLDARTIVIVDDSLGSASRVDPDKRAS